MKLYPISLLLLSHFIVSGFTDLSDRNYCPPNLFRFWPQKENQPYNDSLDYNFIPNDNAQRTGPIYKLEVVSPTINLFEPGIGYRMTLSTTEEVSLIHKFLISIVHNDSFKTPGKLKSLSDKSEPISYNCWKYLIKRPIEFPNELSDFTMVPFEWEAPESGCVDISAQVMDSGDSLFQFDNDPHRALKKTLCVRKNSPTSSSLTQKLQSRSKFNARGKHYCCRRGKRSDSCVLSGDSETFYKAHSKYGFSFESCSFAYSQCCFKSKIHDD
ncbi:uncharacterized protein [Lepeophtheirus salmonis]|uniref:Uncharacterized protein n=1 Tax=Lepeophtheirus salmonis TaxID=72036 RepID=A0A0K2UBQ5_LEPSM|nr:uncharacterized protein LOC121113978 [Lepeophtheirus salmonis]